ncbi:hypothetical protein F4811DRAFT_555051 [Daldinia bambusicola]|nr:hypothetical protein F4811DRAFT_555051 [Daldinia bambusicola]
MMLITILALAAAALATPYGVNPSDDQECTPPAYVCNYEFSGWLVCNVDGTYLDGGNCPSGTTCQSINNLPYCV